MCYASRPKTGWHKDSTLKKLSKMKPQKKQKKTESETESETERKLKVNRSTKKLTLTR
jgi:hypothetical protein